MDLFEINLWLYNNNHIIGIVAMSLTGIAITLAGITACYVNRLINLLLEVHYE